MELDLNAAGSKKRIHFIGIGGIGMSGIARMCLAAGHAVQGSDVKMTPLLSDLEKLGATVQIGHDPLHVKGADLIVYSSSIKPDHTERSAAAKKSIPIIHRAEALAALCRKKFVVAVTGTHGKTTTTALTGLILKEAGRDPSVVVGGLVDLLGGNARVGRGQEMVLEADESDASFLKFSPDIEVITNIEKEHLDYYGTVTRMEGAYRDFVLRLKPGGQWIGCGEDPGVKRLAAESAVPPILYGFGTSNQFYATDIEECPRGERGISFRVWREGRLLGQIRMKILGPHNVLNALGAIAASFLCGADFGAAERALFQYRGAERRFDIQYESPDTMIVDDYAHHPTEIQKTLAAARALSKKRIVAIFQPHRYSRTASLLEEFASSFGDADKLFITDIYAASEDPLESISAQKVCEAVKLAGHPDVTYVPRTQAMEAIRRSMAPGDLVIALGAGDIYQVARELSFFRSIRGKVLREEPLSKHTSLKIGGPAEYWIEPEDTEDLKSVLWECRARNLRVWIFGAGSNLLVADEGVRGVVIHLASPYFRELHNPDDRHILARGGVMNTLFIQYGFEKGMGGFEFLSGIPGNIGGAIAMNAGSHGQATNQCLEEILFLDFNGRTRFLRSEEIDFGYRRSGLKDGIILEALFTFPRGTWDGVSKKLEEYREHRAKTQDLHHASAGCLFKNPELPGCSSGKLIDEAGLKGFTVGKAQVSRKHANFLINHGGATAKDVQQLIRKVRETVKQTSGIELETEVRYVSDAVPEGSIGGAFLSHPMLPSGTASGKIAVLAGGLSCEREVSLISGKAVYDALRAKGYDVMLLDPVGDFVTELKKKKVSLAFIALHGTFGEDGTVQKMLESAGIPYTGSGPLASELAFDKSRAQTIFKKEGILIPDFIAIHSREEISRLVLNRFPIVVKPASAGSSVGISIVKNREQVESACEEAFRYSQTVLVEEYIAGRELTVGILGEKALPIVEVIPGDQFYDYEAKYKSASTRYEFPARLDPEEEKLVSETAMRAYRALGCRVMGRADIILSGGEAYVLELNTIPGLTGKSLLPKAATASGLEFGDLCVKIMELSKKGIEVDQKW